MGKNNQNECQLHIGETLGELLGVFLVAASRVQGPAQEIFKTIARESTLGLFDAEKQLQQGQDLQCVATTRDVVLKALKKEGEILAISGNDPAVQGAFNEMASEAIVKTVGVLNYGSDILRQNEEEVTAFLEIHIPLQALGK